MQMENAANDALLVGKNFGLNNWSCKDFDKSHAGGGTGGY